ncbi:hypothetical protein BDV33DRAFT_193399 [Aspergillus novoparasiticus]|uniref:BTB domain transcription factor n=1 Tax=Aspergillus novoparasiticus TaxID=986946 RepID=A0A5N6EJA4_9EURO|nr:hypothetical protein BDV33DRAFT_193399 [Aspergillus novoparasiticus]
MSDNKQESTPSQQSQNTSNAPGDPLSQNSDHNPPIVIQPYAVEEPEEESPPVSSKPTILFLAGPNTEYWQAELVDSMEDLHCESDNSITKPISRYKRGKKRKPSSTAPENFQVFQKQCPGMPQARRYEDGSNLKQRKLRRRTKQSNEALASPASGLSDVGLSETSTRQAAQKAKEAISAGPDTKNKGGAGAKRKEAAHKGPEPKRSKKENQKPARDEDKKVEERKEDAEEQVKVTKEEHVEPEAKGEKAQPNEKPEVEEKGHQNVEPAEGKKEEPGEEQAVGAKEEQKEEQVEESKEEHVNDKKDSQESKTEQAKSADDQEKPAADGVESGIQKSKEREEAVPSNILEKGVIYFFYRPRVNVSEPSSVDDVARSFIVLRPTPLGASLDQTQGSLEAGAKCRLMLLPKKKFPTSGRERDMGFVEKAGQTMKELRENFIAGEKYETSTRGERTVPEAKPYAEGVYAITSTKRASHLAYILTIPGEVGPLQEDFGLHARGSWIVQSKNPKYPGPSSAQLPKDPEYPESVREKFQDYRWAPLTPEFIDYPNAQFLMIGEATDDLGKAATAESDGKRSEEVQPGEELEKLEGENEERVESLKGDDAVYKDLGLDAGKYPKVPTTWDS